MTAMKRDHYMDERVIGDTTLVSGIDVIISDSGVLNYRSRCTVTTPKFIEMLCRRAAAYGIISSRWINPKDALGV